MLSVQFLCVFIVSLCYASTDHCTTPDGGIGTCKQLRDCPMLMRSFDNMKYLINHYCGHHRFCCSECYTAYGATGMCKDLAECPNLLKLRGSNQESYITNSKCADEKRVCCGPPPPPFHTSKCDIRVSAFPPDPMTGCCGRDAVIGNKIVGGNETEIDEYPWLVILEKSFVRKANASIVCGGALISGRYVLTAAHCFNTYKIKTVLLGEFDRANEGQDCNENQDCTDPPVRVPVEEVIVHPDYDISTKLNDIALIRLGEMVNYTDFIRPICLPSFDTLQKTSLNDTLDLYVAGWGKVNSYVPRSAKKMHVKLPMYDMEMCTKKYKNENFNLWSKQLCAGGEPGKDSCTGDSGGPLMLEVSISNVTKKYYEAIGIVSYGPRTCGVENMPGIYTKVYEYNAWIRSNIRA